ncbi:TIGR02328 family protein [uncultured Lactobacillus sp.]|uniref:TIGR02328 family protein n=1 Tax=uncultured Lactobacillus sp. TaxID=153152 RepID=UPI0025FA471B|nr:TIGR02328 family protein [uncultured Lactobacillus sp.]
MRLWHQDLIWRLPRQQLLGQHREIAALRGRGWDKPHATVNYVFQHSPYKLYQFHLLVLAEMQRRHYHPDFKWFDPYYRGQYCPEYESLPAIPWTNPIYPEHDEAYLQSCLDNLHQKGIYLY